MANRLSQIGNIRALAVFLVVLGHSIILYSSAWDLFDTRVSVAFLDYLKSLIDILQMPLFFSLSGYLFVFTHEKRRGFWHFLKSKTMRLLVPYFGVGILYLLPIRLMIGFHSYQNMSVSEFVVKLLTSSDVGHLWFLLVLFIIFLLNELILILAEKIPGIKKYPEVFLCVLAFALYLEGYRIGFGFPPLLGAYNYLIWFSVGYFLNVHRELVRKVYRFPLLKWGLFTLKCY